jgi:DNA-binding transcriptional ArsR family regulator
MKSHNGMRPQDIVILLKILTLKGASWQYRDLASSLKMSISEVSESLNRSYIAGLVDESKRKVRRQSLMEFLEYGLHYVFPQLPGRLVTGVPTAHSHPYYSKKLISDLPYVWPDADGSVKGLAVQPLFKSVTEAIEQDEDLYKLLASIDIVRVGNTRELKLALQELKKYIL